MVSLGSGQEDLAIYCPEYIVVPDVAVFRASDEVGHT